MSTQAYRALFFKFFASAAQVVFLLLTARMLGTSGRGELSLFVANLTLLQLFSELLNGPAIVYLSPRLRVSRMIGITFIWSIVSNLAGLLLLQLFFTFEPLHAVVLVFTSIALSLFSSWLMIIQGKEKLGWFWILSIGQPLVQLLLVLTLFSLQLLTVPHTLYVICISYVMSLLLLVVPLMQCQSHEEAISSFKENIIAMFKHGLPALVANLSFFAAARTVLYLMAWKDQSNEAVGIYSVAAAMAESIWIINLGLASWLYPRLANETDQAQQIQITSSSFRLATLLSIIPTLIFLLLPSSVYTWLLGAAYHDLRNIILILLPGIFIMNGAKILWNYFNGLGLFKINTMASLAGAVVTVGLCLTLIGNIPSQVAAGISVGLGYICTSIILTTIYCLRTKSKLVQLIPGKEEFKALVNYVRNLRSY